MYLSKSIWTFIGGQAEKQTGCSNLLERMKSAEELQVKLSKSDLQFSAKSVKLKHILVLVSAIYGECFVVFFSNH